MLESVELGLRNNNTAHAAFRTLDQPAPTLYFAKRVNFCAWMTVDEHRNFH